VGFIRKLPHDLVDAFKATLEEAVEADFLIHVLDVTHPKVAEQYQVTNQVLEELGAHDKLTILVLNKIDQEYDPYLLAQFRAKDGGLVFPVSTQTGEGIAELQAAFARHFVLPLRRASLHLPMNRFDLVDLLHREGDVIEERHEADGVWMEVEFPERYLNTLEEFMVERIAQ
jgi:GTP-binding protein HflX